MGRMWYLLPAAGLFIGGILALCSSDEKRARLNWEEKHKNAKDVVEELRHDIERKLAANRQRYDFYILNEYYYSSFKYADNAYVLMRDSKTSLASIKKMLNAANLKRRSLSHEISLCSSRDEKKGKIEELKNLTEFRDSLDKDFKAVLAQKRDLSEEVSRLNNQTRKLKLIMATKCGEKGKLWYKNLEQRISDRNK